jgi:hypothetical protein
MRFPAAHPSRLFAALCVAAAVCGAASADTIYLKNGRKITASNVVQENGQVSYETSAGHLSLPASIVDRVVRDAAPLESAAGTPSDRAANLPIAPPSALSPATNEEAALGAVRDALANEVGIAAAKQKLAANEIADAREMALLLLEGVRVATIGLDRLSDRAERLEARRTLEELLRVIDVSSRSESICPTCATPGQSR